MQMLENSQFTNLYPSKLFRYTVLATYTFWQDRNHRFTQISQSGEKCKFAYYAGIMLNALPPYYAQIMLA